MKITHLKDKGTPLSFINYNDIINKVESRDYHVRIIKIKTL